MFSSLMGIIIPRNTGKNGLNATHKIRPLILSFFFGQLLMNKKSISALLLIFVGILACSVCAMAGRPSMAAPYTIELSTDKGEYALGEKIEMSIVFTNTSSEAMSSYYPSSQRFDFVVTDAQSREVWRWSYRKMFLMVIEPFKLNTGEKLRFSYIWDQKDNSGENVPAGEYYVTGRLTASPKVSSQKIRIDIIKIGNK